MNLVLRSLYVRLIVILSEIETLTLIYGRMFWCFSSILCYCSIYHITFWEWSL